MAKDSQAGQQARQYDRLLQGKTTPERYVSDLKKSVKTSKYRGRAKTSRSAAG